MCIACTSSLGFSFFVAISVQTTSDFVGTVYLCNIYKIVSICLLYIFLCYNDKISSPTCRKILKQGSTVNVSFVPFMVMFCRYEDCDL